MHRYIRGERLPIKLCDIGMSGWETVAGAHAIAYVFADDPERAIAAAAASGGDTDTIAGIVGAIVGAHCGYHAIPARWVNGLGNRVQIGATIESCIEACRL